jgi:hypothetical protein
MTVAWTLGKTSESVETGRDGSFLIEHTDAGELELSTSLGSAEGAPKTTVRAAAGTQDVVLVIDPGAELSVRFDPAITDRGEVYIAPDDAEAGTEQSPFESSGGIYRFRGLRTDRAYTVWTTAGWRRSRQPALVALVSGLRPSSTAGNPVAVHRAAGRSVTVRVSGPAGLANVSVSARRGPVRIFGEVPDGVSPPKGRIDDLVEGRWHVEVDATIGEVRYEGAADADAGGEVEIRVAPVAEK